MTSQREAPTSAAEHPFEKQRSTHTCPIRPSSSALAAARCSALAAAQVGWHQAAAAASMLRAMPSQASMVGATAAGYSSLLPPLVATAGNGRRAGEGGRVVRICVPAAGL